MGLSGQAGRALQKVASADAREYRTPALSVSTWQDFYDGELQGLYALIAVPILFLLYRLLTGRPRGGLLPAAARFVDGYAIVFAIETILDPVISGPLVRMLGLADGPGGTVALLVFLLLGDFRVYLLVFGLIAIAAGRPWTTALASACAWTTIVPIVAYSAETALRAAVPHINPNSIWPLYETLFTVVALFLRVRVVPVRVPSTQPALRAFLRSALLYVAAYYALWALSDLLIQIGGIDAAWLLRVVPNQLYYAFWVPFVFFVFFSRR
jgi:hypothetical protein